MSDVEAARDEVRGLLAETNKTYRGLSKMLNESLAQIEFETIRVGDVLRLHETKEKVPPDNVYA